MSYQESSWGTGLKAHEQQAERQANGQRILINPTLPRATHGRRVAILDKGLFVVFNVEWVWLTHK